MGLFSTLLAFPIALPIRGVTLLAGKIASIAEHELHDPEAIRRALMALEQRFEAGEIGEEDFEREEMRLLTRLRPELAKRDESEATE